MQPLVVERSQVLWHRLRANHLVARLAPGSFAAAAFAGLQDSAPRAALTALHARVRDVTPGDWEHPLLVQTWAPRGAVFVVPRSDLAVFALGILPRDAELSRALERLASRARETLAEPRLKGRDEDERVGPIPAPLADHMRRHPIARLVNAIAGVQVSWDASATLMIPGPAPQGDPEDARRELARRFLRSLGPARPARFARWAAVGPADAKATFHAIGDELVEAAWPGGRGFVLAAHAERLERAEPVGGVRLVSFGDPVLQVGEDVVACEPSRRRAALPVWACTGLVLVDGAAVASWGRNAGAVTLHALMEVDGERREAVEREASSMPLAEGAPSVRWRDA